jgi:hypothetical protein
VSRWLQTPAQACSLLANFSTLKMDAVHSSETSVHRRSTWRYIPEDGILLTLSFFIFRFGLSDIRINSNQISEDLR